MPSALGGWALLASSRSSSLVCLCLRDRNDVCQPRLPLQMFSFDPPTAEAGAVTGPISQLSRLRLSKASAVSVGAGTPALVFLLCCPSQFLGLLSLLWTPRESGAPAAATPVQQGSLPPFPHPQGLSPHASLTKSVHCPSLTTCGPHPRSASVGLRGLHWAVSWHCLALADPETELSELLLSPPLLSHRCHLASPCFCRPPRAQSV